MCGSFTGTGGQKLTRGSANFRNSTTTEDDRPGAAGWGLRADCGRAIYRHRPRNIGSHARFDGIEELGDGGCLVSCRQDSSVHLFNHGVDRRAVRNVPTPADIGIDTGVNVWLSPPAGPGGVLGPSGEVGRT